MAPLQLQPAEELDPEKQPYQLRLLKAPVLGGWPLKAFISAFESSSLGATIYSAIAPASGVTQVRQVAGRTKGAGISLQQCGQGRPVRNRVSAFSKLCEQLCVLPRGNHWLTSVRFADSTATTSIGGAISIS
jgi:hypothetical protein